MSGEARDENMTVGGSNEVAQATTSSESRSANQKRNSFGHQQGRWSGGRVSGQSSLSSQNSLTGSNGARHSTSSGRVAGGGRNMRHMRPLRRQRSFVDSEKQTNKFNRRQNSEKKYDSNSNKQEEQTNKNDSDEQPEVGDENLLPTSSANYEIIRNKTLLFFLDHLYMSSSEGKKARSLHDLSCLFGTREFTKEMRQIVGASRNGLKKFLQSFPSLFQIEDDLVYCTHFREDSGQSSRDYNKEAVDYFRQKLLQFGTSMVPIKNLFGYRSQASQEVRHISGKSANDFKRFLKANEDVFELMADGEHVMLKAVVKELEKQKQRDSHDNGNESNSKLSTSEAESGQPESKNSSAATPSKVQTSNSLSIDKDDVVAMDPYLNKRFSLLIEDFLKKMQADQAEETEFRVKLQYLHEKIKQDCQNELFLKMVKTIEDLRVFLRMHPKLFRRIKCKKPDCDEEEEFVSLVSEEERREMELKSNLSSIHGASLPYQPHLGPRQNSALDSLVRRNVQPSKQSEITNGSRNDKVVPTPELAMREKATQQADGNKAQSQPVELSKNTNQKAHREMETTSHHTSQRQAQLRANAPPFVPSQNRGAITKESERWNQQVNHAEPRPVQRSLSNLTPRRGHATNQHIPNHLNQHYLNQNHPSPVSRGPPLMTNQPIDLRNAIKNYIARPSSGQHNNNFHWNSPSHPRNLANQRNSSCNNPVDRRLGVDYVAHGSSHNQHYSQHTNSCEDQQEVVETHQQLQPHFRKPLEPEDLRARTVDIVREASNIITKIMNTTDAVAFDCKGYNLGFDGQITLIQFGFLQTKSSDLFSKSIDTLTPSKTANNNNEESSPNERKAGSRQKPEVCVFDLITNPELAYCLKPLLESDKVVKIVHDVRNKSNALYVQFKIILNNVFDTQVANLVIQQQDTGKPAYKSRYISMNKLCEVYGDQELLKYRYLIKSKTRHSNNSSSNTSSSNRLKDVNYWRTRPLTTPMIIESTMDVYCLIGGIYQNLKSKLKPEYEPLFDQLNVEGVLARIKPDEIRSAKKGRKIDLEVIDLKRKLYRDAKGPIVLSNREIRLLRHIDLTDEVREKIQQCKKVAKKLERLDMKAQQQLEAGQSLDCQSSDQITDGHHINKDPNDPQSLASSSSVGEMSLSTTTTTSNSMSSSTASEQQLAEDEERILSSFMDSSSMFDELKDKMIESSNLLDSIEDSLRTPL